MAKFLVFMEINNRVDSLEFKYQIEAESEVAAKEPALKILSMFSPSKYTVYEDVSTLEVHSFDEDYPIYSEVVE